MLAGAKQAEEILGKNALEVAALYDQLCVIRFLYERMEEATEAGKLCCVNATNYAATTPIVPPRPLPANVQMRHLACLMCQAYKWHIFVS